MKFKRGLSLFLAILFIGMGPINVLGAEVNSINTINYLENKYSSKSVIFMKDDEGRVERVLMTDFNEGVPEELLNTTRELGIPIHKEIPADKIHIINGISPFSSWTHTKDMDNRTNKHFQVLTSAALTAFLSSFFGGRVAAWTALAGAIVSAYYTTENVNVYFLIQYYWQPSNDPVFMYYVRQDTHAYKDSDRTDYIDTSERYYYSSMPF